MRYETVVSVLDLCSKIGSTKWACCAVCKVAHGHRTVSDLLGPQRARREAVGAGAGDRGAPGVHYVFRLRGAVAKLSAQPATAELYAPPTDKPPPSTSAPSPEPEPRAGTQALPPPTAPPCHCLPKTNLAKHKSSSKNRKRRKRRTRTTRTRKTRATKTRPRTQGARGARGKSESEQAREADALREQAERER